MTDINNGGCAQTAGLTWPGTLTNTGTITSNLGASGGLRYLRGSLTSSGTVSINTNTSYDTTGATFTNSGRLVLAAGASLTMTGSQTLAEQAGGAFEAGIDASAGQGRVVGASAATVAGTLRIDTTGEPTPDTTYPLINATSVSGTFANLSFAGEGYVIQYGSTSVSATVDPEPTITSLSPNKAVQGAVGRLITINGTNFMAGVQESFSGTGITITSSSFVSSTKLTVTVSVSSSAPLGGQPLTVTNPDGGAAGARFTVDPQPVPVSANPSALGQGAVSQTMLINGSGFVTGDTTKFSGIGVTVSGTTVVSSTQLSVVVSVSATATTGSRNITVSNTDGGTGTCTGCFTIDSGPSVTSATPPSVARGTASQDVLVGGANFVSGATVGFSGSGITVNSVTWNSAGQLTVNVTVASNATPGAITITVVNPDHGQGSCATCFTVT